MGWTEGFEPSISRATTWRVNRYATPTTRALPRAGGQSQSSIRRLGWSRNALAQDCLRAMRLATAFGPRSPSGTMASR